MCIIIIGMEASSLTSALVMTSACRCAVADSCSKAHGGHDGHEDAQESSWTKLAAVVLSLLLTVGVLGYMITVMGKVVSKMNLDGSGQDAADIEAAAGSSFVRDITPSSFTSFYPLNGDGKLS